MADARATPHPVHLDSTFGRPNAGTVEQVAHSILAECLVVDGALLTPGKQIWTRRHLAELRTEYVNAPDVSAKSFDDKLTIQLAGVSDGARQLFAELYILNLLPVGRRNLLPATKIAAVEHVLEPVRPSVALTDDVRRAFADGVFNGGRAWLNRRWAQLSFLVEFAEHFKQQNEETRRAAVTDPVLLRKIVRDSPGHREPAQRQALLYLFQPEYFLPIVSNEHRRALRDGLGAEFLPQGPSDDLDADLRAILDGAQRKAGRTVDPYVEPWRSQWLSTSSTSLPATPAVVTDNDEITSEAILYGVADIVDAGCFHSAERLQSILNRWRDKQNLILQGAPGTGKTWLAKRLAEALIGSHSPDTIRSVQFHPNTSYEDFVRGWRPASSADGIGTLQLIDGALLQHAERARHSDIPHVLIIEEINRGNPAQAFGEMLTLIEKSKRTESDALTLSYPKFDGELFYLPDNLYLLGTMNIADRSLALVDFALRRRFSFETLEPALTAVWERHVAGMLPNDDTSLVKTIRTRVTALNERIAADPMLGSQYAIGHSFVTPTDPQSDGPTWFAGVVETEIAPLLHEYWFDDHAKADEAIAALAL